MATFRSSLFLAGTRDEISLSSGMVDVSNESTAWFAFPAQAVRERHSDAVHKSVKILRILFMFSIPCMELC